MTEVAKRCPNISSLEIYNWGSEQMDYLSFIWIHMFQNLEKLNIDCHMNLNSALLAPFFLEVVTKCPLKQLKELRLQIDDFFDSSFITKFHRTFPNLEILKAHYGFYNQDCYARYSRMNGSNLLVGKWKISTILDVLESLGHVKKIIFEDEDHHGWAPIEFNLGEHNETIDNTEHIFQSALEIIDNKFSIESGSFKIVDEKYGFVIFKEKMKPPRMYNQQEVDECPVTDIIHDKEKETFSLKLRSNRKRTHESKGSTTNEVILSEKIVKKLYHKFIQK